jgi:uncharacterized protein (UPF0332 family)
MKEFDKCLKNRQIIKVRPSHEMITKEIESAKYDLQSAEESFLKKDYKWSSIQAYYSMFHAIKALVLQKGFREKSHYCLLVALRKLYVETEELDSKLADDFELSMTFRKEADYAFIYDEESAEIALQYAATILEKIETLMSR